MTKTKTQSNKSLWKLAQQAESFRVEGTFSEAIKLFTQVIEVYPDPPLTSPTLTWLYAHRGQTQSLIGNFSDALDDLKKAIKLDVNNAWAYANLGEVYRKIGFYNKARENFSRAIKLDPMYDWAYAHLGACYNFQNSEEAKEAIKNFSKAITLNSSYAWVYVYRSAAYFITGEAEKAYLDILQAVSLDCSLVGRDFVKGLSNLG